MEKIALCAKAYNSEVYGCQQHEKQIMLTFMWEDELGMCDIFLTQSQAEELHKELGVQLARNKEIAKKGDFKNEKTH